MTIRGIVKSILGLMASIFVAVYAVPLFPASSFFEVPLAMGLMLFLSLDGYRRYISLYKLYQQDQKNTCRILQICTTKGIWIYGLRVNSYDG